MRRDTWLVAALVLFGTNLPARGEPAPRDPADWPTYNHGATGWRFNAAEKHLGPGNVGGLVEKWRFPPEGAREKIGAVHMTPAVVNGHVYFGTATDPTFYKLTPSGKLKWKYRNTTPEGKTSRSFLGIPSAAAFLGSPLVTADSVYFGDIGGFVYCLDRFTGKERWKLNTRAEPFPGAHGSNCVFSSPVLADGKVIVAGGAWEHDDATKPGYECCRGRGFVIALEPATGKLFWKYDVGPEPERFDPPLKISDDWGEHVFHFGPSTSSVWCTPSYDAATRTLYFGTDVHNSPRRPTKEDPRRYTPHSAAVVALDARTGEERWVTQVNPGDVWNYAMRAYDPKTGLYKDQSIGDTPKIYTIPGDAGPQKVVGCGCKNGGFYVFDAADGKLLAQTPVYKGPPAEASELKLDPRTLALPGPIGGLQTGCATDGNAVFANGTDAIRLLTSLDRSKRLFPPTGGRVTSLSPDLRAENWRHERPRLTSVGGYKDVGDPVGSGIAVANGVLYFTTAVSNKLVALEARTGKVLKEIDLGPVWCGPSVSRGRVYVGTGNILFAPPWDSYFPKRFDGTLRCFGLPGEDEVDHLADE